MSRDRQDLHPVMLPIMFEHIRKAALVGISLDLIETWRGQADQDDAKRRGASQARWRQSWHNVTFRNGRPASLAYHLAVRLPEGGLLGFGKSKLNKAGYRVYEAVGIIGAEIGLRWGGDWDQDGKLLERGENDLCHFEYHPNGAPLSQVWAAMMAQGDIHVLMET